MSVSARLHWLGRKLVHGATAAGVLVGSAYLGVTLLELCLGGGSGFTSGAATRVGLSAFLGGLVFFPVTAKSLATRAGFALRCGLAGAAFAVMHRLLYWAPGCRGGLCGDAFSAQPFQTINEIIALVLAPEARVLALHPGEDLLHGPLLMELCSVIFCAAVGVAIRPALLTALRPATAVPPLLGGVRVHESVSGRERVMAREG